MIQITGSSVTDGVELKWWDGTEWQSFWLNLEPIYQEYGAHPEVPDQMEYMKVNLVCGGQTRVKYEGVVESANKSGEVETVLVMEAGKPC